ncbi:hypothetical protein [Stutzerimonas stutzeri]|uniref:hypothetical protein n=1 Tax=Stutzerimonas stutzeri TaxID=316 RepID=UPI002D7D19FE|nr:hypothetical protein [Pseudomonas aeruginosa]HEP8419359.1 hypothetical protein [Pseudomonas aeruginosa]
MTFKVGTAKPSVASSRIAVNAMFSVTLESATPRHNRLLAGPYDALHSVDRTGNLLGQGLLRPTNNIGRHLLDASGREQIDIEQLHDKLRA